MPRLPLRPPSALRASFLLSALFGCGSAQPKGGEGDCPGATSLALSSCVDEAVAAHLACLEAGDALCGAQDPALSAVFEPLKTEVEAACAGGALSDEAARLAAEGLAATCALQVESLVGRVAGGPQAAVWAESDPSTRECLTVAIGTTADLVVQSMDLATACLGQSTCEADGWSEARAALQTRSVDEVEAACPTLSATIAVDPTQLVENASSQVGCLLAAARSDAANLGLECGPSAAAFSAPRGEWTQVVVDSPATQCADGGAYAFWIRPAPEGAPLDRLMIGLEGGGVCVFEEDCTAKLELAPELFSALDNTAPEAPGIGSQDPAESPFADWTHVYLPYCTQDVFAGGGVDEVLGDLVVPRYGAVNARTSIRMVRDWLWAELEADPARPEGYRQDQVQALFGGWSAGSYGTLYNYAWMLDELGWPRTTAFPDAGLALDNGETLGVAALGVVKIPAWGTLPLLPPYCFHSDCALGSEIAGALAPRLLRVPEQQLLLLSNQVDDIQAGDAYFTSREGFVNALRQTFCDTRELNGVSWYLTGVSSESVHVISPRAELWAGEVAGVALRDWMEAATNGERVPSLAEEGDLVTAVPGATPFPCALD